MIELALPVVHQTGTVWLPLGRTFSGLTAGSLGLRAPGEVGGPQWVGFGDGL